MLNIFKNIINKREEKLRKKMLKMEFISFLEDYQKDYRAVTSKSEGILMYRIEHREFSKVDGVNYYDVIISPCIKFPDKRGSYMWNVDISTETSIKLLLPIDVYTKFIGDNTKFVKMQSHIVYYDMPENGWIGVRVVQAIPEKLQEFIIYEDVDKKSLELFKKCVNDVLYDMNYRCKIRYT